MGQLDSPRMRPFARVYNLCDHNRGGPGKVRTHVILPEDLVKPVDALAGKGKRSSFVEEAVRDKVRKEALLSALAETAGMLSAEEHPEWATPEKVAAWVRESRQKSDESREARRRG